MLKFIILAVVAYLIIHGSLEQNSVEKFFQVAFHNLLEWIKTGVEFVETLFENKQR